MATRIKIWNGTAFVDMTEEMLSTREFKELVEKIDSSIRPGSDGKIPIEYLPDKKLFSGHSTYNGAEGTVIHHNIGATNYAVHITTNGITLGDIGEIYVTNKTNNSFTVHCTGDNTTSFFDWIATVYD